MFIGSMCIIVEEVSTLKKKSKKKEQYLGRKKFEVPVVVKRESVKFEKKKQDIKLEDLIQVIYQSEKFLTLEEVAEMYGVNRATVRRWAYRGHVPLLVLPSRFYIPLSDLKRYKGK
jgi:excisionase family DNA binding protein